MKRDEVANSLHLSKKTIDGYMVKVLGKLAVETDAAAVRMVMESGWIDTDFAR